MIFYAVLNKNDIVIGVKQVKDKIEQDNHIKIKELGSILIGNKYNYSTKQFEIIPVEPELEIDISTLSENSFRKMVLERLGFKIKQT